MGSAALFLMAATVSAVFGWQPMQDGSPRYEYIVQLEPELVETLEEGPAIPITTDIPEHVGPIGRIRIVVGRGELPREQLVTQFKPIPESNEQLHREGIVETQYTQKNAFDRYSSQASSVQILPPDNKASTAANSFANELRQGANQAIQNGAEKLQNQVNQILPPQGNGSTSFGQASQAEARQLFGGGGQERSILPKTNQSRTNTGNMARNYQETNQPSMSSGTILPPSPTAERPAEIRRIPTGDTPPQPSFATNDTPNARSNSNNLEASNFGQNPSSQHGVFNAPFPPVQQNSTVESQPNPRQEYDNRRNNPPANYTNNRSGYPNESFNNDQGRKETSSPRLVTDDRSNNRGYEYGNSHRPENNRTLSA